MMTDLGYIKHPDEFMEILDEKAKDFMYPNGEEGSL